MSRTPSDTPRQVTRAARAGFCMGVARAVRIAAAAAQSEGTVYTLGSVVHNPRVTAQLQQAGVRQVESLDDVPCGATLVVRAHGIPHEQERIARQRGITLVDATCTRVRDAMTRVQEAAEQGYPVVIVGDRSHPEIRAVASHAGEDHRVVADATEWQSPTGRRVALVAQTTLRPEVFQQVVARAVTEVPEVRAFNTICRATNERQQAARELARAVEVMVVVGGRSSANTRHLVEVCAAEGVPVHLVEGVDELESAWFRGTGRIGVTAGASTPEESIEEVIAWLERDAPPGGEAHPRA